VAINARPGSRGDHLDGPVVDADSHDLLSISHFAAPCRDRFAAVVLGVLADAAEEAPNPYEDHDIAFGIVVFVNFRPACRFPV